MLSAEVKTLISSGGLDEKLAYIYACSTADVAGYRERFIKAIESFEGLYGADRHISIFSAPGRTEIGGNHTDHQRGRVLAASVNLDVIAIVSQNPDTKVRIKSEGHRGDEIDAKNQDVNPSEVNTSRALIRGICARYQQLGYTVGGFDAYTTSNVLTGSGLSSSAAFEVLVGTIVNELFCGGKESALSIAQIGQYAENVYFGKPCGLMDQAASSVGGFVQIDFQDKDHPEAQKVDFDFTKCGYALCIIDTKGSHSDLTPDYAAVPAEMKEVAAFFGKEVLRDTDENAVLAAIPALREKVGDRAILRALHFFAENRRVAAQKAALKAGDLDTFLANVIASGRSSFCYLQNVYTTKNVSEQGLSLALCLAERVLSGKRAAWRVHGGGFAGTIQAFVPTEDVAEFRAVMDAAFGEGRCMVLRVRPEGALRV